jgi:hypothetical protein
LILLIWAALPDINNLWSDPDTAWTVYLTLGEACKALACLYLVRNVFGWSGALWFTTQAINEATGNNAWPQDGWQEYAAFGLLALAACLYHKHHKPIA